MLLNLASAWGGKTGESKPTDFMPFLAEKPAPAVQTPADHKQAVELLTQLFKAH